MYTIIIAVVVTVAIYAILSAKKVVKDDVRILFILAMFGMAIGTVIAAYIPQRYEISKCDVYYISDDKPINIQIGSKEITFFAEEVDGKPISMDIKVGSLSIEHTSDKNSIEVITYVRTNKFAIGGPKVKANVLMSSNPHQ